MALSEDNLLALLTDFQQASRISELDSRLAEELKEKRRADVTGRWKGYDSQGYGLVEYQGEIYKCVILSNKCKQRDGLVNLRRTPRGNFADWQ